MDTQSTQELLQMLKIDLGIRSEIYDSRLSNRLTEAMERLAAEGITLTSSAADKDLVVMYAAWLWRDRVTGAPMPRMLVMARNNRLFGQKARTAESGAGT